MYKAMAKMTTAPKTRIDQFILTRVGLLAVGKKVKIMAKQSHAREKTLMAKPNEPSEKRAGGIPPGWKRTRMTAAIGRMYVVKRAAIITDATALKAAVDPMLIKLSSTVMMVETSTEQTGIWV